MIFQNLSDYKYFSIFLLMFVCTYGYAQNTISATYSSGDISTYFEQYNESCSAILSITLPEGDAYEVTGIDISYNMQASNSGFMSDQRSQVYCQNTSTLEAAVYSGVGSTVGTYQYTRDDVNIANQEYGGGTVLTFEMRAWRTFGSSPVCGGQFNMVENNTWEITVNYSAEIVKPKIGINTEAPNQTLDVNGKIKIGNDGISPTEGTVRYEDGNFEGYDGNNWGRFNAFDQTSQGTLLFSRLGTDENLIGLGYELAGSAELYNSKTFNGKHLGTFTQVSVPSSVIERYGHSAVWTGTEMLIWGGVNSTLSDPLPTTVGYREVTSFNPSTNVWTVMPLGAGAPPETRRGHSAVWTGSRMIIWGGRINQTGPSALSNGYSYDPSTNTWTVLSQGGNIPTPRFNHDAIWTGSEMIVYGGGSAIGGRYNLATGNWSTLPLGPSAMSDVACVFTGARMLVYGRGGSTESASFNVNTNNWIFPLPSNGPHQKSGQGMDAVWTGSEMIVWGGSISGGRYSTVTENFLFIGNKGPIITYDGSAVWTGTEMIIFGGAYNPTPWIQGTPSNQCYRFTLTGEESSFSTGGTQTIFYYDKAD